MEQKIRNAHWLSAFERDIKISREIFMNLLNLTIAQIAKLVMFP